MDILNEMTVTHSSKWDKRDFKNVLEDHLTFIKQRSSETRSFKENTLKKWAGDFGGLLHEAGISADYHYITARINGLDSLNSDFSELFTVIIPDEDAVDKVLSTFK